MAQVLIDLIGTPWIYIVIFFFTGVLTSIAVEAINLSILKAGKNIHPWWIVFATSLIADIALVYLFRILFADWGEIAVMIFADFFFPILFYYYAGT